MVDPLAEVGIKLLGNWTVKELPCGVLLSEHKTVFLGSRPRQRHEWEAVLRHHGVRFEHAKAPKPDSAKVVRP